MFNRLKSYLKEIKKDPDWLHIRKKATHILVTNVCNLSCGACDQLCGQYPKEKMWFISMEELKEAIATVKLIAKRYWNKSWFPETSKKISIFGGEPTLHPKWNEMVEIFLQDSEYPYVILTNGRTFPDKSKLPKNGYSKFPYLLNLHNINAHDRNLFYRVDYKNEHTHREFSPTMVAPIDIIKNPDKNYYFEKAKRHCAALMDHETLIYKGKAYFCFNAGALDDMFYDRKYGWEIKSTEDPFEKTNKEIREQASHFCYRCGWCLIRKDVPPNYPGQFMDSKTLISKTNYEPNKLKNESLYERFDV